MANQGKYNDIVDTGFLSICKNIIDLHLLLMERFKNRLHSEYIMYYAYMHYLWVWGVFRSDFFFCILGYKWPSNDTLKKNSYENDDLKDSNVSKIKRIYSDPAATAAATAPFIKYSTIQHRYKLVLFFLTRSSWTGNNWTRQEAIMMDITREANSAMPSLRYHSNNRLI